MAGLLDILREMDAVARVAAASPEQAGNKMDEVKAWRQKKQLEQVLKDSKTKFRDSEYYLYRAEEARVIAMHMQDAFAKQSMLKIADDYEQMAHVVSHLFQE